MSAIAWLSAFLLSAGLTGMCAVLISTPQAFAFSQRIVARTQLDFGFLRLRANAEHLWIAQCILSLLCVLLFALDPAPWAVVALAVAVFAPSLFLRRARTERIRAIDSQVEGWLVALSNGLKSTPSIGDALEASRVLVTSPLRDELEVALRSTKLGVALDDALDHMAVRVESRALTDAVLSLCIARNMGGNLPKTLELTAGALREMVRLDGVVRTKTAEGKAQTWVISLIPVPLIGVLHMIDPTFLEPMNTTNTGRLIELVVFALWGTAILWARRIIQVDL
jgi:tight adherence protein B